MPNVDKTGPTGEGPTGLGRGGCVEPQPRQGGGRGLGVGRRALTLEEEEAMLKTRLEEVQKRKDLSGIEEK